MSDEPTDPFSTAIEIEGEPAEDQLRSSILSRDLLDMPTGDSDRRIMDKEALSETERARLFEAKLVRGPGKWANAYERALHEQYQTVDTNYRRMQKLIADHEEIASYDPASGAPVYAYSDIKRKAMATEITNLQQTNDLIAGPAGQAKLHKAIDRAVAQERDAWRRKHIEAAAQRLAQTLSLEDAIKARAELIRKTKPSGGLSNSQN